MRIVPRWEWRAFEDSFGAAGEHLAGLTPERVEETAEVYLVSRRSDASVKVRDGRLDVKCMVAVDDAGLEQWMPVMKAPFPLGAEEVRAVLRALGVSTRAVERAGTADDLAGASPHVRAVPVRKRRVHHRVGGCMTELTEIHTAAGSRHTIAVESEDPALVAAAVRDLGLSSRRVVCMARGLKALVGFGSARYAVVDVGTNSVKFHVGERSADGEWRTVVDRAEVTRLGEALASTGRLSAAAVERTVAAVAGMAAEAERADTDAIAAVGTAGLRVATNAAAFIDAVRARCGLRVEVISGEEEARLAYLAARAGLGHVHGQVVVFDTGGGSTQFTFGDGDRVDERFSLGVGAVRLTERYRLDGTVSEDALATVLTAVAVELAPLQARPVPEAIVGMGGAVTNLAAVAHGLETYDADVVHGTRLDLAEIDRQIERYRTRTAADRRSIAGLQPARADVILAGACVVRSVLGALAGDAVTVCDRGLRHGLLVERFGIRPPVPGPSPERMPDRMAAADR